MPRRLIAMLAAVVLTGCPSPPPATSPPDAATPTPYGPVRGEARIDVVSTSAGPIVFHSQPAPAADGGAGGAFAAGVVAWLDRHLTDLQAGGPGLLGEVAAPGLLPGAPAESVTAVTGALASPQRPVATAVYHVVVAQEGPPLWARVNLTVQPDGGAPVNAGFVFTPGPPLVLVALQGPPSGAAP
ncbi:MAG: hypothetical protein ABR592_12835 [Nitriliruptorales bacterium]